MNCKKIANSILLAVALAGYISVLPAVAQQTPEEAELQRLEEEIERLNQALEPLLQDLESLDQTMTELEAIDQQIDEAWAEIYTPETAALFADYQINLATCSPATYEDLFLPGITDSIQGWVGDTCQVDKRTNLGDSQWIHQCFYTRQDIELITGPGLYLPDDLERECHRIK